MTSPNDQLERLLENAKRIQSNEFADVMKDHDELVRHYSFRLRPSVGSISLVSCANSTPQLGFSNITSASTLRNKLDALKDGRSKLEPPSRDTPEKSVQSWLILQAMENDGHVKSIEHALDDDHSYRFVSDEIALSVPNAIGLSEKPKRVVADLLLVRVDGNGESELVNVELKSERTSETHGQIKEFWPFMGPDHLALWRKFAETMLRGKELRWKEASQPRGLVIWPARPEGAAPLKSTVRLISEHKDLGIDTIGYFGPEYGFRSEHSSP
ncbi:hypothetical protein [Bradyrhizobium sp. NP1]|uniref:hypothetical protein n=1 Tax=Bradyrhizobium sp. NP1 TaxID=3049772 RepID=UPI0025A621F5|nr:hypothetical protein [Bradyrhizobium sp. NP1]WJR76063.1 hypothetical protein QOU61_25245 [Bradyrhizobium sp. NP1]